MEAKIFALKFLANCSLTVAIISLIANILSFYIFSRKKFKNTIFSFYFRVSILFYSLYLIILIDFYVSREWNIDFRIHSNWTCKLRYYYANVMTPIPHYIMAFVSIDRFLTIVHPTKFLFRNKISFKLGFCFGSTLFNLIYYVPDLLFYGLQVEIDNQTSFENKTSCKRNETFLSYLNFLNDALVPFGIMMIFTILLIKSIHESRKRARSSSVSATSSISKSNRSKSKDIRFAISSIVVNLVFIFLTLQAYSILFIDYFYDLFLLSDLFFLFYYCKFGSVFFVSYFTNSIFRNEFRLMIGLNHQTKRSNQNRNLKSTVN
jgi:hypothetical protein